MAQMRSISTASRPMLAGEGSSPARCHASRFRWYVVLKKEEAVTAGESYVIFERKTFAEDIHSAVVGQKVVIRYVEDRTSKAGTEYKYVVAKLGAMDEAAEKVDVGDAF